MRRGQRGEARGGLTEGPDGYPPQDFCDEGVEVRKVWTVLQRGKAIWADDRVELCAGPALYVLIDGHGEEK